MKFIYFKIMNYELLTQNWENGTAAIHTAPPVGLV